MVEQIESKVKKDNLEYILKNPIICIINQAKKKTISDSFELSAKFILNSTKENALP